MRASGLIHTIFAFLLLFSAASAAWPWSHEDNALVRRQNNNDNNNNDENTSSGNNNDETTTESSASRTASGSSASASDSKETDSASGTQSGSSTRSGSGSRTSSKSTKTTNVDPRLPAGGVELVTPAATEGSQYYKVGDYVTFEWNYTSLSNTPSAIDVFATCSLNQATYTIASNMSVEETGRVIWNTGDDDEDNNNGAFPVATYTLFIHDAARDPTQVASAGDLGAYNQFRFGMYTPQPYTPLNEFRCSTCNGALSLHEQQLLGVLGMTALVTVISFSWFANGFGLFA